jgi:hypothetical protein
MHVSNVLRVHMFAYARYLYNYVPHLHITVFVIFAQCAYICHIGYLLYHHILARIFLWHCHLRTKQLVLI